MSKKKRRVIEIFEFKLRKNISEQEFVKVLDMSQKFFSAQEGYEHRLILINKNVWVDQIQWRNEDYGKSARQKSKTANECKDYYQVINFVKVSYPEMVKMY